MVEYIVNENSYIHKASFNQKYGNFGNAEKFVSKYELDQTFGQLNYRLVGEQNET